MDWPMADQIAARFKKLLPPALQDGPQGNIPPQVAQQMQQMQQMLQMAQQKIQELESGERPMMAKVQVQAQESQAKLQLQTQEAQAEHERSVMEAQNAAEFERWKARLEAETKIIVAQIGAKAGKDETLIKAENDANIAFMQSVAESDVGEGSADGGDSESSDVGAGATAQPASSLRDLISGLGQTVAQMGQQNSQMMQMMHEHMQGMTQMMSRPKHVSLQRDGEGRPMGATVQ